MGTVTQAVCGRTAGDPQVRRGSGQGRAVGRRVGRTVERATSRRRETSSQVPVKSPPAWRCRARRSVVGIGLLHLSKVMNAKLRAPGGKRVPDHEIVASVWPHVHDGAIACRISSDSDNLEPGANVRVAAERRVNHRPVPIYDWHGTVCGSVIDEFSVGAAGVDKDPQGVGPEVWRSAGEQEFPADIRPVGWDVELERH